MHRIELASPPIEILISYPNGLVTKGVRIIEGLVYCTLLISKGQLSL